MTVSAKYYCAVKDGSPPEHNDDAAAADESRGRFAISDGAAESGFSRVWSKLLVDQFVAQAECAADDWKSWLPAAQQRWRDELKDVDIPWYGEQQFEQGSFATFLGLVVPESDGQHRRWHAVAVGDSCLFHTRDHQLQESFPLEESAQFNFTPKLVGSRSDIDEVIAKRSLSARGIAEAGDILWLMSDALAKWCLAQDEAGQGPWEELTSQFMADSSADTFHAWLDHLRADRGLQNDDVTLMLIRL
jgi:hypothetical protein